MLWGNVPANSDPSSIIQFTKQYVGLADTSVSNVTTEVTLLSTTFAGIGKTIAANKLSAGSVIRVRVGGTYSIPAILGGTLTIKIKLGTVTLVSASISSTLLGSLLQTDQAFDLTASLVVRGAGTNVSIAPTGSIYFMTASSTVPQTVKLQTAGAVAGNNTTIANDLEVTAQWSVASTSRAIKAIVATINLED